MKLDPSKHAWMTAPEIRKLMASLPSRNMAERNPREKMTVDLVIFRDKTKKHERRHAY
jgi:hypothetical protein